MKLFCEISFVFWTWQHQKRSTSARLAQILNLTMSKTKQFCETSSIFEADSIKNDAILRDFLQKWKVECRADGLVPMRFAIFPIHLSKVLHLPRESDARSYEVLHLSRKIISANLKIWCSKMQPLSGNQRPDLLTALMNMSLVLRLPRKMDLRRSSSNVPHLPSFFEMLQNPHVLLTVDKVHNPLRLPRETTSERPKVVRACWCFKHLTWKCASRHNSVDFFDISTSKSGLNPSVFYAFGLEMCFAPQRRALFDISTSKSGLNPSVFTFDLEMCFAPQRCALFRYLNFQKWSEPVSFLHFWLGNVLRATMACTFSKSQLPKAEVVCTFLTWKCASRHTGVHFFISHLASWLRTRRFSEPTFRPSGATNHWKNTVFCNFPTFSRICIFFLLTLSLLFLIFFLLFFSDSSHLCFSSVHIVGGLTSKLPSIMAYWIDTIVIPIYIYVFMGLYICIHI